MGFEKHIQFTQKFTDRDFGCYLITKKFYQEVLYVFKKYSRLKNTLLHAQLAESLYTPFFTEL